MSLAEIFGDFNFSSFNDDFGSSVDFFDVQPSSVDFFDSSPGSFFDPNTGDLSAFLGDDGSTRSVSGGAFDDFIDPPEEVLIDDRSLGAQAKDFLFDTLGVGPETAKAISAFAKAANRGGGKERQAQGSGRTGPALPTSARAPTTPAGRTSRARQATSGERAIQAAISQSNRAQSAARAIANQMARAGTVTTTNDLADMISGATSPKGTKQALPGTRLRQLAIPRTA